MGNCFQWFLLQLSFRFKVAGKNILLPPTTVVDQQVKGEYHPFQEFLHAIPVLQDCLVNICKPAQLSPKVREFLNLWM